MANEQLQIDIRDRAIELGFLGSEHANTEVKFHNSIVQYSQVFGIDATLINLFNYSYNVANTSYWSFHISAEAGLPPSQGQNGVTYHYDLNLSSFDGIYTTTGTQVTSGNKIIQVSGGQNSEGNYEGDLGFDIRRFSGGVGTTLDGTSIEELMIEVGATAELVGANIGASKVFVDNAITVSNKINDFGLTDSALTNDVWNQLVTQFPNVTTNYTQDSFHAKVAAIHEFGGEHITTAQMQAVASIIGDDFAQINYPPQTVDTIVGYIGDYLSEKVTELGSLFSGVDEAAPQLIAGGQGEDFAWATLSEDEIFDGVIDSLEEIVPENRISAASTEHTVERFYSDGTSEVISFNPNERQIENFNLQFTDAEVNGIVISSVTNTLTNSDGSVFNVTDTVIEDISGDRYFVSSSSLADGSVLPLNGVSHQQNILKTNFDGTVVLGHQEITTFIQNGRQHEIVEFLNEADGNWHVQQTIKDETTGNIIDTGQTYIVPSAELLVSLQATGGTAGSVLGSYLADGNVYQDVIYSTFLKTVGEHFGTFSAYLANDNGVQNSLDVAVNGGDIEGTVFQNADFAESFFSNLNDKLSGVLGGLIINEVGDVLGIEGVAGEIVSTAGNAVTAAFVSETIDVVFGNLDGALFSGFADGQFFSSTFNEGTGQWETSFDVQGLVVNALASYAGSRLAGEIIEPESETAAIFGSLGSGLATAVAAANAAVGSTLASIQTALTFGLAGGPVGIAISAFIGTALGTALGNMFGGEESPPEAWARASYNGSDKEYIISLSWDNHGGDSGVAESMLYQVIQGVNSIIALTHGTLRQSSHAADLQIGYEGNAFRVSVAGSEEKSFSTSVDAISYAAYKLMQGFDLVGGHAVLMRAWHNSDATNIYEFKEDIEVAEAFQNYLANPTGILAMMMNEPDSELAQSWAAILQRAAELRLHMPHEKDLDGGWGEVLRAQGLDPELIPELDGDTIILTDPVTGEETVLHYIIGPGYEIVRIEGTDGDDIIEVIVDGSTISYVEASAGDDVVEGSEQSDVIVGGAGDDTLNGNGGNDWLHGGAGEDEIDGGEGDDLVIGAEDNDYLVGGAGNDKIYGNGGDDYLFAGNGGDDYLYGGDGNDYLRGNGKSIWYDPSQVTTTTLSGGEGDDTLLGANHDILMGGAGDDTYETSEWGYGNKYVIGRGGGHDVVITTFREYNTLTFDDTISFQELYFMQSDTDLKIIVLGEDQSVTVQEFYASNAPLIKIEAHGGKIIANNRTAILQAVANDATIPEAPMGQYNVISDQALALGTNDVESGGVWVDTINGWFNWGNDTGTTTHTDNNWVTTGGAGNDILESNLSNGYQIFYGDSGDDTIWGYGSQDLIIGGLGNDTLYGGQGPDRIMGGHGNDILNGGAEEDSLLGNAGDDFLYGKGGDDNLNGGDGNDYLDDAQDNNTMRGGEGDDYITAELGLGNNKLYGDGGNDTLIGGSGLDTLYGGLGDDILQGGIGDDWLDGESGDDDVKGSDGDDVVSGGEGDDTLYGDAGKDELYGGAGLDQLYGGDGHDYLEGGAEADALFGDAGDDDLHGDGGGDTLKGGVGNDLLNGGLGSDILRGGAGFDVAVFEGYAANYVITDYTDYRTIESLLGDLSIDTVYNDVEAIRFYDLVHYDGQILSSDTVMAVDDSFEGAVNTVITGNVLLGDDQDMDFYASALSVNSGVYSSAMGGVVELFESGDFNYTPSADYIGADSFEYTALNSVGGQDIGTVSLTVNPPPPPEAPTQDQAFLLDPVTVSTLASSSDINAATYYDAKTIALSFETGSDVLARQVLYEQGGNSRGLNLFIENGKLYQAAWNYDNGGQWGYKEIEVNIAANTKYTTTFVFEASSNNVGTLTGYINGSEFASIDGLGYLYAHGDGIGVGGMINASRFHGENVSGDGHDFAGQLGAAVQYNAALDGQDLSDLHDYLAYQWIDFEQVVTGTTGDDILHAGVSVNIVTGEEGDDVLYGGFGDDVYVFNVGDGHDTIHDADGFDVVRLGAGLSVDDVVVNYINDADYIEVTFPVTATDKITIAGQGDRAATTQIEQLVFDDGTTWDLYAGKLRGSNSVNDNLHGSERNDFITGINGNDKLYGYGGNDLFYGGANNDQLYGGDGDDIFLIRAGTDYHDGGDGIDTAWFAAGSVNGFIYSGNSGNVDINLETQRVYKDGRGGTNNHTIINVENVVTGVGNDTVRGDAQDNVFRTGSGNDLLNGREGNDIMYGEDGDDVLYGGFGDDVYVFNVGDGQDTIYETEGLDVISLGAGFVSDDLVYSTVGSDQHITFQNSVGDRIIITDQFDNSNAGKVERIHFFDGTEVFLYANTISGNSNANTLNGTDYSDYIVAGGGNDVVHAYGGNDYMKGGSGNDKMYGGDGTDIFLGSGGNDKMYGEAGDDFFFVRNDSELYDGGDGIDTILFEGNVYGTAIYDTGTGNIVVNLSTGQVANDSWGYTDTVVNVENVWGSSKNDQITGDANSNELKGLSGNDTLYGDAGDDALYGDAGNDTLYGGLGRDTLTGGAGSDRFVFESDASLSDVDTITDFNVPEGDAIDISDLLDLYDPLNDSLADFVQITDNGTDSTLAVDADGGADTFSAVATLENVTGLTDEQALVTNGNLIVA
ncbi:MAG: calcium-binding protein [Candidatus Thiodiazotropha sp.]